MSQSYIYVVVLICEVHESRNQERIRNGKSWILRRDLKEKEEKEARSGWGGNTMCMFREEAVCKMGGVMSDKKRPSGK